MRLSMTVPIANLLSNHKANIIERVVSRKVKKNIFNHVDQFAAFTTLKKAGIRYFELILSSRTTQKDIIAIKNLLNKNDIRVASIHQPFLKVFRINMKDIEKYCKMANTLEAKVIVVHATVFGRNIFNTKLLKRLKELEKKYNVLIGIENCPKNLATRFRKKWWKPNEFSKAVEKSGLGIVFDTAHLGQVGGNIVSFYKKNKEKIINIHLSDFRKTKPRRQHLPVGEGNLPMTQFIKLFSQNDSPLVTLETNCDIDGILQSVAFIKNIAKSNR